jgi:hypothetical protein
MHGSVSGRTLQALGAEIKGKPSPKSQKGPCRMHRQSGTKEHC